MMPGNDISQYPAVQVELSYCVLRSGRRVIDAASLTFEMCLVAGYGFDAPLKFRTIFPQVVPEPRDPGPISAAEHASIFSGALPYAAQVFA